LKRKRGAPSINDAPPQVYEVSELCHNFAADLATKTRPDCWVSTFV